MSPSLLTFLKRFAIACLVVVVVTSLGVVAGNAFSSHEFAKSQTVHIDDKVLAPVQKGQPANYLLLGSDVRPANETPAEARAYGTDAQTGGARSDVMMVLHVDPNNGTGMLVSFPRDLIVDIPGHGQGQLNAAYAYGGPSLVIQTLEADFAPLKINHYIGVDFRGFKSIVDAIGHVQIYFPTPAEDAFTGLSVPQGGCASLNGDEALAYARSRHYNVPVDVHHPAPWNPQGVDKQSVGWIEDPLSDLDRIPRQQYFLRTISQFALDKVGNDPTKIFALMDAVFQHLTHDQNLKLSELKLLANTFKGLNPAKIDMETLPWTAGTGALRNRVLVRNPDAAQVIARLMNFPPPQVPQPQAVETIKVRVVNGSGVKGAAAAALGALTQAGFKSAGPAEDADRSDYKRTKILYAPGKFFAGITAASAVGTTNLGQAASAKNTLGGDVLIIVGADYSKLQHNFENLPHVKNAKRTTTTIGGVAGGSTTTGPSTTTTTTTTVPNNTTPDTRFVPVDPKTGGALVGCPAK